MRINLPSITPGDWRIGDAGLTVFGPPNGKPSPRTVARMPKFLPPCNVSDIDENIANSKAIAAVPAMLRALATLLEEAPAYGFDGCNVQCLEMAKSALLSAGCKIEP